MEALVQQNDALKRQEAELKADCRGKLAALQESLA